MTKIGRSVVGSIVLGMLIACLAGCKKEGPMERTGKEIDTAADKTGQKIDRAVEKAGRQIENAARKLRNSAK